MALTAEQRKALLESRLKAALSPLKLQVIDESHLHVGHKGAKSGASHFALTIVAKQFTGLNAVKRHQLIYNAVKDFIPHEIHALKIKAQGPEE